MTKLLKRLVVPSLIAFCFAVCACLFGACVNGGKPEDNAVKYTVTVQFDETMPAGGVDVQLSKGSAKFPKKTTDANGKAEFELAPDGYEVALSNLPEHYGVPEDASLSLTAETRDLTVTLAKKFAYIVKLVNPDGTAYYADGVTVGVCTILASGGTGNCLTPVALERGGVATIEDVDKGDYHVKVEGLPANAKIECDADGYYTGKNFSATETEMEIKVYTVTPVTEATPMTDAEKTAYRFKVNLAKDAIAYYSITPEFDGEYLIYRKSGEASNYLFNEEFTLTADGLGLFSVLPYMQAGKTYFLNVYNDGDAAADFEFVIEAPAASYTVTDKTGEVEVTVTKQGAKATIRFKPAAGAAYKVTGPADIDTSIIVGSPHEAFAKNAVCTARFTEDMVGSELYFSVAVSDETQFPVSFKVKIEKTADLVNTTAVKRVTETLTKFEEQEGTLTEVPVDGTAVLVYNDTDKFYHLGTADGPVVVVMLTGSLGERSFAYDEEATLAYIDKADRFGMYKLVYDVTVDKTSLTAGNAYDDYRVMLRGFADYNLVPSQLGYDYEIPENIAEEHYYVKYVNKDGVYPLTKELEAFLKGFAAENAGCMPNDAADGSEWLFACYYYETQVPPPPPSGEKDVIVGEYEFNGKAGNKTLTVNENGSFVIIEAMGSINGTWVKNADGTYTFTEVNDMFGEVPYNVVRNAETGELKFYEEEDPEMPVYEFEVKTETPVPEKDVIVGEYEFNGKAGNKTLTVNENGSFVIIEAMGSINGTWVKNADGTYTFTEVNDLFGEVPYNVVRNAETGELKFYEEEDPEMPVYEFEVKTETPVPEKDVIVGEYEFNGKAGNKTLTVNENGSFVIIEAMGSINGTWVKNADGTYTFTEVNDMFGEVPYNVVRNAETGELKFYEEEDPEMPVYEFEVKTETPVPEKDVIVGEYEFNGKAGNKTLTVNENGSFVIIEAMGSINGTWVKNADGTYTFTEVNDMFGEVPYNVVRNAETGELKFYEEEDPEMPVYEFEVKTETPVPETPEEEA